MITGAKSAIVSFSAAKIHLFCEKAILTHIAATRYVTP